MPTVGRASLPVNRVRMDVAYYWISTVLRRANLTLGHGLLPSDARRLARAGHQRMGAMP